MINIKIGGFLTFFLMCQIDSGGQVGQDCSVSAHGSGGPEFKPRLIQKFDRL